MKKAELVTEVKRITPLPGQRSLLEDDDATEAGTQQVTIRVSREAVAILAKFAETNGVKRNRLFDEAIQMYSALLEAGKRVR